MGHQEGAQEAHDVACFSAAPVRAYATAEAAVQVRRAPAGETPLPTHPHSPVVSIISPHTSPLPQVP